MEDETNQGNETLTLTELGKMLRSERIKKGDKNARKMSKALGITPSMLSEIENGKTGWKLTIEFLIRCRDYFGWNILNGDNDVTRQYKAEKTIELFEKGLLSYENISLNMKYIKGERKDILAKIIPILLLTPDNLDSYYQLIIGKISTGINDSKTYLHQNFHRITIDIPTPPPQKKIIRSRKPKSIKQD